MSVNIYFQPANPRSISTSCPNQTIETLARAFGDLPITLKTGSIPVLEGMMAADPNNEAWQCLIDNLERHNEIIITIR